MPCFPGRGCIAPCSATSVWCGAETAGWLETLLWVKIWNNYDSRKAYMVEGVIQSFTVRILQVLTCHKRNLLDLTLVGKERWAGAGIVKGMCCTFLGWDWDMDRQSCIIVHLIQTEKVCSESGSESLLLAWKINVTNTSREYILACDTGWISSSAFTEPVRKGIARDSVWISDEGTILKKQPWIRRLTADSIKLKRKGKQRSSVSNR